MPHGVHRNPNRTYRPDPELDELAKRAVKVLGVDMNGHILAFLRWLTHETDELPTRPPKSFRSESASTAKVDTGTPSRSAAGPSRR